MEKDLECLLHALIPSVNTTAEPYELTKYYLSPIQKKGEGVKFHMFACAHTQMITCLLFFFSQAIKAVLSCYAV